MTHQFDEPGSGGDFWPEREACQRRLLVVPIAHLQGIQTEHYGTKDPVKVNVVDLETGEAHYGVLWYSAIVGKLKHKIGKKLLGYITQQPNKYNTLSWTFESLAQHQDTVALATQWLNQNPEFLETCEGDLHQEQQRQQTYQPQQQQQAPPWQQSQQQQSPQRQAQRPPWQQGPQQGPPPQQPWQQQPPPQWQQQAPQQQGPPPQQQAPGASVASRPGSSSRVRLGAPRRGCSRGSPRSRVHPRSSSSLRGSSRVPRPMSRDFRLRPPATRGPTRQCLSSRGHLRSSSPRRVVR